MTATADSISGMTLESSAMRSKVNEGDCSTEVGRAVPLSGVRSSESGGEVDALTSLASKPERTTFEVEEKHVLDVV